MQKSFLNLQREGMTAEFENLHRIMTEYQEEIRAVQKDVIKTNRKINSTQIMMNGVMQILDPAAAQKEEDIKVINPRIRQRLLAERKERERELLKKKIAAGVDLLGDTNDIRIQQDKQGMSYFARLSLYLS